MVHHVELGSVRRPFSQGEGKSGCTNLWKPVRSYDIWSGGGNFI